MANFGIGRHAHTEAALSSILLTLLTYGIKWLFGLGFPQVIFTVPTFMAIFIGLYVVLYLLFLIAWSRK